MKTEERERMNNKEFMGEYVYNTLNNYDRIYILKRWMRKLRTTKKLEYQNGTRCVYENVGNETPEKAKEKKQ